MPGDGAVPNPPLAVEPIKPDNCDDKSLAFIVNQLLFSLIVFI
jgi:hypothetical protein